VDTVHHLEVPVTRHGPRLGRYLLDRGILDRRGRRLSEGVKRRGLGRVHRDHFRCGGRRPIVR
jgi:hypothetical protein